MTLRAKYLMISKQARQSWPAVGPWGVVGCHGGKYQRRLGDGLALERVQRSPFTIRCSSRDKITTPNIASHGYGLITAITVSWDVIGYSAVHVL